MVRYLKIEANNIISDMISYEYGDYIRVEKENFPVDLHNGCYRYIDGEFILDETLLNKLKSELLEIKQVE